MGENWLEKPEDIDRIISRYWKTNLDRMKTGTL
jgi:hypothetical protein